MRSANDVDFTLVSRVASNLCNSNIPMAAKCIAGSCFNRYHYRIVIAKIGDNVLTRILATEHRYIGFGATE